MKLKNIEIMDCIRLLDNHLNRKDLIGYAVARNIRNLRNNIIEYEQTYNNLMEKYGEPEVDDNGNETGRYTLDIRSSNFKKFRAELTPFANIEHDVKIFKIPYSSVIGELTGQEILDIDWMLDDIENPQDC